MLVDKGTYATSTVCMLEIATAQLKNKSPLDELQVPKGPSPIAFGSASEINSSTLISGGSPNNDRGRGLAEPSAPSTGSPGVGTRVGTAAPAERSSLWHVLGRGFELLERVHGATDDGLTILNVVRRGSHMVIAHAPLETKAVLRKALVAFWRSSGKYVKLTEKASKGMEMCAQLHALGHSLHSSLPVASSIINGNEPWATKTGKLCTWFSAASLSTVANIELGPAHTGAKLLRTGAGMFGANVMHPSFGNRTTITVRNRSFPDPRMFFSWQFLNYLDSRAVTVYDTDTVYLFLHARIDHP